MINRFFGSDAQVLTSGYHLGNARSKAVLTKLGFVPSGKREAKSHATDETVTIQEMVLNRTGWEALQ
ncbi:MAG: hypothetical protein AB3N19_18110 [Ruegeria sp.]